MMMMVMVANMMMMNIIKICLFTEVLWEKERAESAVHHSQLSDSHRCFSWSSSFSSLMMILIIIVMVIDHDGYDDTGGFEGPVTDNHVNALNKTILWFVLSLIIIISLFPFIMIIISSIPTRTQTPWCLYSSIQFQSNLAQNPDEYMIFQCSTKDWTSELLKDIYILILPFQAVKQSYILYSNIKLPAGSLL